MSCIYLESDGDTCGMYCKGEFNNPLGVDSRGGCRVNDDPDPNIGCDTYQGCDVCGDCGADADVAGEECSCD